MNKRQIINNSRLEKINEIDYKLQSKDQHLWKEMIKVLIKKKKKSSCNKDHQKQCANIHKDKTHNPNVSACPD